MPFVQRVVEPKYVSRTSLFDENGKPKISDGELDAVTNSTLSNALRQLASLVLAANDIFTELTRDLQKITERSHSLKTKIEKIDGKVATYDPKKVSVPESDISTFALLKNHYARRQQVDSNLFSSTTRPNAIQALYDAASKTPVHVIRQMDRWRRDGTRSSRFFVCTPVLGQKRKKIKGKIDIEIETRMPAAVEELRRWTSTEALGDITVTPDCPNRIPQSVTYLSDGNVTDGTLVSDDEGIDHKLPSPEEQVQAIALKFPAEVVAVDISGRRFSRLSSQRRSVLYRSSGASITDAGVVDGASSSTATRRQTRSRRSRTRRRTTLAGTDEKEIKNALEAGEGPSTSAAAAPEEIVSYDIPPFLRSKSSDILRSSVRRTAVTDNKKSHFQTLKEWSRNKFKLSSLSKSPTESQKNDESNKENENVDSNVYETITVRKRRSLNREKRPTHERNPSYSSSEKSSVSIPIAKPLSSAVALAVRLRDTSSSQRRFRKSCDNKDEPRSSSGNWSASSESGRASIASEITTHPKSTTSAATSNNSLNHPPNSSNSTRKFTSVSASDSVTSEGTLTPDIHDIHEDLDSSSVYSCDTEGYYTSFHMDSGLKTLKEEETPVMPFHTTSAFSTPGSPTDALSAESEYELFGKGSTSTTASSAGTVCTTLKAGDSDKSLFVGPSVPERKSSLSKSKDNVVESKEKNNTIKRSPASSKGSVIAVIHKQTNGDISPDSGHNTSSSPTQSANSPNGGRSGSEFEYSECSDMEGTDRIERIRSKTAINSSRIPSMCVITPPHSDDESVKSFWEKGPPEYIDHMPYISLNDLNAKTGSGTATNFTPNAPVTGYVTLESLEGIRKPNDLPATVPSKNTFRAPSPSGGSVTIKREEKSKVSPGDSQNQQPFIKASLLPLNVFGKLKLNIPNFSSKVDRNENKVDNNSNEYDEYVTIADIRNNNGKIANKRLQPASSDMYSDTVSQKLNDVLTNRIRETEYVSLDELPSNPSPEKSQDSNTSSLEKRRQGARVTLDAEGKVVYSSDSLKRKKNAHTTFQPGPFVKSPSETPEQSPLINRRTTPIRPVQQQGSLRPMSPPQYIIRAPSGMASPTTTKEVIRMPSSTVIAPPSARPMSPKSASNRGAYVHMQKKPSESLTTKGQVLFTNAPTSSASQQDVRTWTLPQRKSMNLYNPWSANTDSLATLNYCDYSKFQTFPHRKPDHYRSIPKMPDISMSSKNPIPYEGQFELAAPNGRTIDQDQNESLKISPIEPFKPQHTTFQSSTPKPPESLKHAINLESKLLSPKKSTMSNEELYAVIHKSKKKLNILTDMSEPAEEPIIPKEIPTKQLVKSPETGYLKDRSRGRLSWSPSEDQLDSCPGLSSSPGSRQSWAHSDKKAQIKQTSQMDFKRLLLQQSAKSNITSNSSRKLSAVEQLKLSKEQAPIQTKSSSMNILDLSSSPRSLQRKLISTPPKSGGSDKPRSPAKLMSPRSQWRFASPRTDVLSSTILEDCREDESSGSSLEKKSRKNESEDKNSPRNDNNNISPKLSVSQYIRAKRAQFFSSTPKSDAENASRFGRNISNNSSSPKDLPTLETSF